MEERQSVEKSIIKKFRKEIWKPFVSAVVEYELIQENDRIAVCMSGGKDSALMAKCMQEIQKHGKFHFDLVFLVMDPGYSPANRQKILSNAALLGIPIQLFESQIFDIVADVEQSPCYLCARMRRGYLYSRAQQLGCNKIALGHHFDDVIETILMSMLYSGEFRTMMPKLKSTNFPGMELIRPMYKVKEADILRWKSYHGLDFLQCACHFTEHGAGNRGESGYKRQEMKELVSRFRQTNPYIDRNIMNSAHNVNLNTVIGYRDKAGPHNFLDTYGESAPDDE